jgi:hypothetical protein
MILRMQLTLTDASQTIEDVARCITAFGFAENAMRVLRADGGVRHVYAYADGDIDRRVLDWTPHNLRRCAGEVWKQLGQCTIAFRRFAGEGKGVVCGPEEFEVFCRQATGAAWSPPSLEQRLRQTQEVLEEFAELPDYCASRQALIRFVMAGRFRKAGIAECEALGLPVGQTVRADLEFEPRVRLTRGDLPGEQGRRDQADCAGASEAGMDSCAWPAYAVGAVASRLLHIGRGETVVARVQTLFGTASCVERVVGEDGGPAQVRVTKAYEGLCILTLLAIAASANQGGADGSGGNGS